MAVFIKIMKKFESINEVTYSYEDFSNNNGIFTICKKDATILDAVVNGNKLQYFRAVCKIIRMIEKGLDLPNETQYAS